MSTAAQQSPLLSLPGMVRGYDSVVCKHDPLALQPPRLFR